MALFMFFPLDNITDIMIKSSSSSVFYGFRLSSFEPFGFSKRRKVRYLMNELVTEY